MRQKNLPIGVFDSGVGGLSVLHVLRTHLPEEDFLYLGDTARLPYGTKSANTVIQYMMRACDFLLKKGIKMLVIACNTACATAYPTVKSHFEIPIVSILNSGGTGVCQLKNISNISILATEATLKTKAYHNLILSQIPHMQISEIECNLLIPLAEEGWFQGAITESVVKHYIDNIKTINNSHPDCIILGCTHLPVFTTIFQKVIHESTHLFDPAESAVEEVLHLLKKHDLRKDKVESDKPPVHFYVTDNPERFLRIARQIYNKELKIEDISIIDL